MAPKKPSSKKPAKPSLDVRIKTDAALRKRVLANPGLRSKLSVASLQKYAPAQAKQRALSQRLAQPIAPGSSITERDLAHEAQAAQTVRYAPQERELGQQIGVAQQTERDTGSFYDQYQQALQQHSANIAAYQAGAQQGMQQAMAGITGLAGTQAAQLQQQQNAGAAQQGVAPAGDLTSMANQAAATRQALGASFQVQGLQQNQATQNFASNLANVVAPTQKLGALAQARGRTRDLQQKKADLATEEGAFNQQFRSDRRGEEFKNQLAMGALNLNAQKAQTDADAKAATAAANTPAAKAAATSATASASTAAKYGYTAHQWAMLGPTRRQQIIAKAKKTSSGSGSDTVYTQGPFAGRKKSEIAALSDSERQRIVRDYNAGKGSGGKPVEQSTQYRRDFRRKYGIDPLGTPAHNTLKNNVSSAQNALKLIGSKDKNGKTITTQAIVDALSNGGVKGIPKVGALGARVALEIARGGLTAATANRLHHAGYSVAALGLKMRPTGRAPRRTTKPASQKIPGVGRG